MTFQTALRPDQKVGDLRSDNQSYKEKSTVTIVTVAASLQNKYFKLRDAAESKFHVWFNLDSGGADPAPAGSTAIAVAVTTGESLADIATATAAAIDAKTQFVSSAVGAVVTIENADVGQATDIVDFNSGHILAIVRQGFPLGYGPYSEVSGQSTSPSTILPAS